MASLHLSNVPDEIMSELRQRADHFHRPVEEEAASILVHAIASDRWRGDMTAEQLLERARKVREGHPQAWVTEEFLRVAKNNGRP